MGYVSLPEGNQLFLEKSFGLLGSKPGKKTHGFERNKWRKTSNGRPRFFQCRCCDTVDGSEFRRENHLGTQ